MNLGFTYPIIIALAILIPTNSLAQNNTGQDKSSCAMELDNPEASQILDILSDSILCLYRSGPDTTMRETCVTDLLTVKSMPIVQGDVFMDALRDTIICIAQTDSKTTCTADLEAAKPKPDSPMGESINATSKSIICLARR